MSSEKDKSSTNFFKTKHNLNKAFCDKTFKNNLRNDDPSHTHNEIRMIDFNPKIRKCKEQTSHIFSGEEPNKIKYSHRQNFYVPSNIIFNDDYVEKNPKINNEKKLRYIMEKKWKDESKQLYSDELIISKERQKRLDRKIKDNFIANPIKVLTNEQSKKLNEEEKIKNNRHAIAYNRILNSEKFQRTLKGIQRNNFNDNSYNNNKVTNDDFNITQKANLLNKNQNNERPYFGRKHFRHASCGGNAFTYL